jgi:hypothetical protein
MLEATPAPANIRENQPFLLVRSWWNADNPRPIEVSMEKMPENDFSEP